MEILQPKNAKELAKMVKNLDFEKIKLDSSANKGITNLDKDNLTVAVRTGTTWSELDDFLKNHNYESCIYPKDTSVSIDEWIQTDGINLAGFKFGPTGRSLYDIEIVTYQGDLLNLGFKTTLFDALGYELKRLFLNSHNTLGITTECILQIRRRPETKIAIKIDLTPEINLKDIIAQINRKSLFPTLIFLTKSSNQSSLYILFDGERTIANAQVNVLKSALPNISVYDINPDEFLAILHEKTEGSIEFYLIAPSKFKALTEAFQSIPRAIVINQNTVLVAIDLSASNTSGVEANSKILDLSGKKAFIDPSNVDELRKFGDPLTPELIDKIRRAFGSIDTSKIAKKIKD